MILSCLIELQDQDSAVTAQRSIDKALPNQHVTESQAEKQQHTCVEKQAPSRTEQPVRGVGREPVVRKNSSPSTQGSDRSSSRLNEERG